MFGLNKFVILSSVLFNITFSGYAFNLNQKSSDDKFCNPTKSDKINVHIISHTHLDAGWVKTYDEYYEYSVKDIMKTVIQSLLSNEGLESRKFTFAEMSYFSRYWNSISDEVKQVIQSLVSTGKLQFTSGGWVMNDESTPHYSMIINQMSYGHRWIARTFGRQYIPTTGWQIDPFGHSREFASILSQMGFNALFLGRIDYQDKSKRMTEKSMEFIWKTDPNLKLNNYLFTGITPNGYYPEDGVCMNCWYEQNGNNLIRQILSQIEGYRTHHIMATMGGDFDFVFAEMHFRNLDKMIEYVNRIQNDINLVYSTPDCYVKAVYESKSNWTDTKSDDFLPYADKYNDFWSGYFTSRPTFKYIMNYANKVLQVCKQLSVLAQMDSKSIKLIEPLEESISIGLHHDAISGTSKQYVSDDYIRMLTNGLAFSEELIAIGYQKLFNTDIRPQFCHQLNISECLYLEQTNGFPTQIVVYNPFGHKIADFIRLPLIDTNYQIVDNKREVIYSEIIQIPQFIQSLSERNSSANYELLFETILEPLSFTHFTLENIQTSRQSTKPIAIVKQIPTDVIISNDKLSVTIDGMTGLLKAIKIKGLSINITQYFAYYTTTIRAFGKSSGAYAMHTNGSSPTIIIDNPSITVIQGNLTEEVIQEFNPWLKQIIRVYRNCNYIEFDWTVGPLPDDIDYELITRFETDFKSDQKFYTDSNGRQTLERKRDFRETWDLVTDEKVSSNYYPITSWIFIKDLLSGLQLTVMPDRTQGGSSLNDGSVELMIHRRLLKDDGYGMEEQLDEPGVDGRGLVVRGKHILLIDRIEESMKRVKILSKTLIFKPLPMFLPVLKTNSYDLQLRSETNGLKINNSLDESIHLLSLEQLEENILFIRLENFLEISETNRESVSLSLNELFFDIEIINMIETSLTGTELLSDVIRRKFKWNCSVCVNEFEDKPNTDSLTRFRITLSPNQIRSFILEVKRNNL